MLAHKLPQHANIVALMFQEVKTVHAPKSELQEVVIEGLFGDTDQSCGVFKRVANCLSIAKLNTIVELAPEGHAFHDKADLSLLGSLQVDGVHEAGRFL